MTNREVLGKQESGLRDLEVKTLLAMTATAEPNPGGGGISALTAAFAMQLSRMAVEITGDAAKVALQETLTGLEERAERLSVLLTEDGASFQGVLDAMRLPKGTDEEKQERKDRIAQGYLEATHVPFEAAEHMLWALERQKEVAQTVSKISVSDVATATLLLEAALHAVLYNVSINAKGIKDDAKKEGVLERKRELDEKAALYKEEAIRAVHNKLEEKPKKART